MLPEGFPASVAHLLRRVLVFVCHPVHTPELDVQNRAATGVTRPIQPVPIVHRTEFAHTW